mmetsp:Transcript_39414/g.156504  ORF Transcript_39414/g.156504 Transcript_39414/m.156504 type:complete len:86 (-) Transcript_39414:1191-1448(-)
MLNLIRNQDFLNFGFGLTLSISSAVSSQLFVEISRLLPCVLGGCDPQLRPDSTSLEHYDPLQLRSPPPILQKTHLAIQVPVELRE